MRENCRKYGVYTANGKVRKAYVLDVLTRYTCPGCVVKALTQMRTCLEVDAIFRENHDLAVSLLIQALRNLSKGRLAVNGEVNCGLGRLDILVKRLNGGLLQVQTGGHELIIEIKTNMSFGMKQALRYLIEKPDATAIIWRVRKRQILVIDGRKHRWLIIAYIAAALQHGLTILNEDYMPCNHDLAGKPFELKDPQAFLDDFLASLVEGLPKVVDMVMRLLRRENTDEKCSSV